MNLSITIKLTRKPDRYLSLSPLFLQVSKNLNNFRFQSIVTGTTHELLVIARDNGIQPLETSVFLTIHISDERNGEQSTDGLQITWLTDNGEPVLMENLTIGYLVARLELGDEYINGWIYI